MDPRVKPAGDALSKLRRSEQAEEKKQCNAPSLRSAPIMSAACCARRRSTRRGRSAPRARSPPTRLKAIEDREIERVIKKQEDVGLHAITDGEFRRSWWHLDFLWGLDGVEKHIMEAGVHFAAADTRNEGVQVTGKLGMAGPHPMVEHFKFVAAHTKRTPKITIPAPSAIYGRPIDDADRQAGLSGHGRASGPISATPTKRRCAASPTPAAAICSSTRCSSPCCAIRSIATR